MILRTKKNPKYILWVIIFLLVTIFFVANHKIYISQNKEFQKSAKFTARSVSEGNIQRRIGFFLLGIIGIVLILNRQKNKIVMNSLLSWLLILFFIWCTFSIFWSIDYSLSLRRWTILLIFFISTLGLAIQYPIEKLPYFVFVITLTFLSFGVIVEFLLRSFHPLANGYRFAGTLHPNSQGTNCALLVLSSFYFIGIEKKKRWYFLVALIFGLIFLTLTKSRTSFVSIIIAISFMVGLKKQKIRKFFIFFILVWIIYIIYMMNGDIVFREMWELVLLGRGDSPLTYTLTGRIPIWEELFEYVKNRPLFGYGYNSFWTTKHIFELELATGWPVTHSHSEYLEVLLGIGLVGTVLYLSIVIVSIYISLKRFKLRSIYVYSFCFAFLIFYMLRGILESGIMHETFEKFIFLWIVIQLTFISSGLKEKNKFKVKR